MTDTNKPWKPKRQLPEDCQQAPEGHLDAPIESSGDCPGGGQGPERPDYDELKTWKMPGSVGRLLARALWLEYQLAEQAGRIAEQQRKIAKQELVITEQAHHINKQELSLSVQAGRIEELEKQNCEALGLLHSVKGCLCLKPAKDWHADKSDMYLSLPTERAIKLCEFLRAKP